jgi:hypothetical protein
LIGCGGCGSSSQEIIFPDSSRMWPDAGVEHEKDAWVAPPVRDASLPDHASPRDVTVMPDVATSYDSGVTGTGSVAGYPAPTGGGFAGVFPLQPPARGDASADDARADGRVADAGGKETGATVEGPLSDVGVTLTSNGAFTCLFAETHGGEYLANLTELQIYANGVGAGSNVTIGDGYVGAIMGSSGSDCVQQLFELATSGSVSFTEVSYANVAGSYDLTFGTDTIQGTFSIPGCRSEVVYYNVDAGTILDAGAFADAGAYFLDASDEAGEVMPYGDGGLCVSP